MNATEDLEMDLEPVNLLATSLPDLEADLGSSIMEMANFSLFSNLSSAMNASSGNGTSSEEEEAEQCDIPEDELDMCHLHTYDTLVTQIRLFCECILVVWSTIYLGIAIRERGFLGGQIFKENMVLC